MKDTDTIAGRTLAEWKDFARRDDCLERMVPSDLRQLLGKIPRTIESKARPIVIEED